MLYLAIPAHNEAATIGVLLWRLRTVLAEFPREYEAVVYDDASSDSTSEILESYAKVMPLTVLRGERQVGYAGAVDALVRHVSRDTRYPRRDAMLLMQGDFTDSPWMVPEFVRRFEGGTDVVAGERIRTMRRQAPGPVKRFLQFEPWLTRFLVRAEGIRDLTSSYRLVRISVLRDLLRSVGAAPVCAGDSRTANADFIMRLVPLARRVEALPVEPTWEVRLRETRVVAVPDAMNLLRWAWRSRGRRAVPSTAPETTEAPRHARNARDGRADLRLEGRADLSADAVVVVESGRSSNGRDAGGGRNRKSRAGRSEANADSRNEARSNSRNESRAQTRNNVRPDSRSDSRADGKTDARSGARLEGRTDGKSDEPLDSRSDDQTEARRDGRTSPRTDSVLPEGVAETPRQTDATPRERPPRRKRTRGRRDSSENAVDAGGAGLEDTNAEASTVRTSSASPSDSPSLSVAEGDPSEREFSDDIVLSSALSDAVADVELEMDGGARARPPRKKRRRRGSRGLRAGAHGPLGDDTADEATDSSFTTENVSEDGGDAPASDFADGHHVAEIGSADAAESAEARVRRRGRRGRRGGSRRSKGTQRDGENDSGGEDFSPPPPSAPAPED
ncbi:MAG: glycosyltransferase [Gemmatimonas sp.]